MEIVLRKRKIKLYSALFHTYVVSRDVCFTIKQRYCIPTPIVESHSFLYLCSLSTHSIQQTNNRIIWIASCDIQTCDERLYGGGWLKVSLSCNQRHKKRVFCLELLWNANFMHNLSTEWNFLFRKVKRIKFTSSLTHTYSHFLSRSRIILL